MSTCRTRTRQRVSPHRSGFRGAQSLSGAMVQPRQDCYFPTQPRGVAARLMFERLTSGVGPDRHEVV